MIPTSVYSIFIVVLVMTMKKEYIHAEAKQVVSMANIKHGLQALCNDVENLPERICDYAIDGIETRASNYCLKGVEWLCGDKLPWSLRFFLPTSGCTYELSKYVCGTLDKIVNFAKSECIEEFNKIVIGNVCDAQGNKENLCNGLLTSVDGVCTLVVDTMCDELPFFLHPLKPYCESFLGEWVCEKVSRL